MILRHRPPSEAEIEDPKYFIFLYRDSLNFIKLPLNFMALFTPDIFKHLSDWQWFENVISLESLETVQELCAKIKTLFLLDWVLIASFQESKSIVQDVVTFITQKKNSQMLMAHFSDQVFHIYCSWLIQTLGPYLKKNNTFQQCLDSKSRNQTLKASSDCKVSINWKMLRYHKFSQSKNKKSWIIIINMSLLSLVIKPFKRFRNQRKIKRKIDELIQNLDFILHPRFKLYKFLPITF